jgi:hypothetical protein
MIRPVWLLAGLQGLSLLCHILYADAFEIIPQV